MAKYERAIKIALNEITGKQIKAEDEFANTKDAFQIRKEFHQNTTIRSCIECGQKLNVSTSRYDHLHYKHEPGSTNCILKDNKLSPKEAEQINKIISAKESPRHHHLKNLIGEKLANVEGVEKDSISIDNKFIIRDGEKRKPDVYCRYKGKDLVFEIQLSDLSLTYILNRYDFYRKNKMYLIWILDNFDVYNQGTLEKDIKYLAAHQNFFKLDESIHKFHFSCKFKYVYITQDNQLSTKWFPSTVALNNVHFDEINYQIYYYDFTGEYTKLESELRFKIEQLKETERKKIEEERVSKSSRKVNEFILEFKKYYKGEGSYIKLTNQLRRFHSLDIELLNQKIQLTSSQVNGIPIFNHWIRKAKNIHFLKFLLDTEEIDINVNTEHGNKTALIDFEENENLIFNSFDILLFQRGYFLKKKDVEYFNSLYPNDPDNVEKLTLYELYSRIKDKKLVQVAFYNSKILLTIESIKQKRMIGFRYDNQAWVNLANNSIHHRPHFWGYVEFAFKGYGIWEELIKSDKNGTFAQKFNDFLNTQPEQNYDLDEVIKDLYPELFAPTE